MTSIDIATQAIEVLNKRGHCKRAYEFEGAVCLVGAIKVVLTGDAKSMEYFPMVDFPMADTLLEDMANDRFVLKRVPNVGGPLTRLFKFNDVSSKRSVIALLNRSIKRLSQS